MIQVACPACQASYEVDERRVPASGMRMRCPKCGSSFIVAQDGMTSAAPAVAPPPPPPSSPGRPRIAPPVSGLDELDLPVPKSSSGFGELDLPTPKSSSSGGFGELDLPTPKSSSSGGFGELDLPTPKSSSSGGFGELDLPTPKSKSTSLDELDLPAPKSKSTQLDELDLPAPKAKAGGGLGELDLPTPKSASGGGFGELDLPAPKPSVAKAGAIGIGGLDLPVPKPAAPKATALGLGDLDLPIPKSGGVDLPTPKAGAVDLPTPKSGGADLPTPKLGGDFELDLPVARTSESLDELAPNMADLELGLPQPGTRARGIGLPNAAKKDPFAPLDLGLAPVAGAAAAKAAPAPAADPFGDLDLGDGKKPPSADPFGELDLGGGAKPAGRDSFGELDLGGGSGDELALPTPRARSANATPDGRAGAGSTGFGELDLDGTGGGGDAADELEFGGLGGGGDIPDLDDVAPIVRESIVRPEQTIAEKKAALAELRKRRAKRIVAGTVAALVVGGGAGFALKFTKYGVFGQYALESYLPSGGSPESAKRAYDAAERKLLVDTYGSAREGLEVLSRARREEGLNRTLLARSLLLNALFVHRFGDDPAASASINAMTARLRERADEAPFIELAQAAAALAEGDTDTASAKLSRARRANPGDVYLELVAGEIALEDEQWDDAATAFRKALTKRGGAAAAWGLARALVASGDAGADAALDAVLTASPRHVEARTEKAKRLLAAGEIAPARALAREASGLDRVGNATLKSAPRSHAAALTVLGRIEEVDSHRGDARYAYDAAASIDGFNVDALVGSGRVLLDEGLTREALVRFTSAIETRSTGVSVFAHGGAARPLLAEAHFGAIRALIALERAHDAGPHLEELDRLLPADADVSLARGRVAQAANRHQEAEAAFRKAIELAPERFDGYLALSQLFFTLERPDDAAAALTAAEGHVAITAEVRRLEGEIEIQRGRLPAARAKFEAALALDPNDRASRFLLGVAYRREGMFAEAARELDRLVAEDPGYPGLSVERAQIFEAMGRAEDAVAMYRRALLTHDDDLDLQVRLGGAEVAAGMYEAAEATLRGVLERQANHATATHFLGRLFLARGELDEAVAQLQTAVRLEPNRAEFHAFLAAAFLEKNNLASALAEIRATLERDPTSVDGHLLQARLLARSGQIDQALAEVAQALAIDPRRTEAWAIVGECEEQRGRRPQAISAYRAALGAQPTRGDWWSRLARNQVDSGDITGGIASYRRAAELGDRLTPRPLWSYEAWRAIGNVSLDRGDRVTAADAYRRYLETAPAGAAARGEVQVALSRL